MLRCAPRGRLYCERQFDLRTDLATHYLSRQKIIGDGAMLSVANQNMNISKAVLCYNGMVAIYDFAVHVVFIEFQRRD